MFNKTFSAIVERLENERDEAYIIRLTEKAKEYGKAAKALYETVASTVKTWAESLVSETENATGSTGSASITLSAQQAVAGTVDGVMTAICKGINSKALKDNLYITSTKSGQEILFEVESANASGKVQCKANVHSRDGQSKQFLELVHKGGRRRFEDDSERERQTWVNISALTGLPIDACEILTRAAEAGIYAQTLKEFAEAERLASVNRRKEASQQAAEAVRVKQLEADYAIARNKEAEAARTEQSVQVEAELPKTIIAPRERGKAQAAATI